MSTSGNSSSNNGSSDYNLIGYWTQNGNASPRRNPVAYFISRTDTIIILTIQHCSVLLHCVHLAYSPFLPSACDYCCSSLYCKYMHDRFRFNWPSSRVQVGLTMQLLQLLFRLVLHCGYVRLQFYGCVCRIFPCSGVWQFLYVRLLYDMHPVWWAAP
jgi:hypothetical protein